MFAPRHNDVRQPLARSDCPPDSACGVVYVLAHTGSMSWVKEWAFSRPAERCSQGVSQWMVACGARGNGPGGQGLPLLVAGTLGDGA